MDTSELLSELEAVNDLLAGMKQKKEALERKLIEALHHDYDGQHTYDMGNRKVTVKTTYNYTIDRNMLETLICQLPDDENPFVSKINYSVNKSVMKELEARGTNKTKEILAMVCTKKPSKPSVSIAPNI